MRIALLTSSYPRREGDPAGHFVQAEARALVRAGHDVCVIAPGEHTLIVPGAPRVHWLSSGSAFGWPGAGARLRERPWRGFAALAYMARARRALIEAGPLDRIVAHWLVPSGFPLSLAARRGVELEIVAHGSDVRLLERTPLLARWILRRLLARGASLRAVSHELAAALGRIEPRALAALRVEACAIDLPSGVDRSTARARLHPDSAPLIVAVGRLVESKRWQVALGAARLVPRARCVVLGEGPLFGALQRQFPGVEFLGMLGREECLQWIAAADLLVNASRLEGAPSVVREARALGTSVVACAAGDLDGWAEHDASLYVLTGDAVTPAGPPSPWSG